jgi:hypothetical protein
VDPSGSPILVLLNNMRVQVDFTHDFRVGGQQAKHTVDEIEPKWAMLPALHRGPRPPHQASEVFDVIFKGLDVNNGLD